MPRSAPICAKNRRLAHNRAQEQPLTTSGSSGGGENFKGGGAQQSPGTRQGDCKRGVKIIFVGPKAQTIEDAIEWIQASGVVAIGKEIVAIKLSNMKADENMASPVQSSDDSQSQPQESDTQARALRLRPGDPIDFEDPHARQICKDVINGFNKHAFDVTMYDIFHQMMTESLKAPLADESLHAGLLLVVRTTVKSIPRSVNDIQSNKRSSAKNASGGASVDLYQPRPAFVARLAILRVPPDCVADLHSAMAGFIALLQAQEFPKYALDVVSFVVELIHAQSSDSHDHATERAKQAEDIEQQLKRSKDESAQLRKQMEEQKQKRLSGALSPAALSRKLSAMLSPVSLQNSQQLKTPEKEGKERLGDKSDDEEEPLTSLVAGGGDKSKDNDVNGGGSGEAAPGCHEDTQETGGVEAQGDGNKKADADKSKSRGSKDGHKASKSESKLESNSDTDTQQQLTLFTCERKADLNFSSQASPSS